MKVRQFALNWWPVGIAAALGLAAAVILVAVTPKTYTATSTLFLGPPGSTDSSGAYSGDLFSQQRAATYSELVENRDLAVKVISDLALTSTPEELSAKVSAEQIPKTVLVKLSATDTSARHATDIANTYAADFSKYVARLETPIGASQPISAVEVIQKAELPTSPTSPNTLLITLIGVVGGTAVGLLLKWLIRTLNRRVRTAEQAAELTGAPVLGVLPADSARRDRRLDLATDATSTYADAIRKVRTNLLYADVDAPPKTIAFVSPTSTISTTATATNLAVVLDGMGRRVALVDGDMRQPRLARYVGQDNDQADSLVPSAADGVSRSSLSSVIAGDTPLDDAIGGVAGTGLEVLFAGPPSKVSSEILASDALTKLLTDLRNTHDFVFCDTPGHLTATDAAVTGLACDAVILVATQRKTRIEGLSATAEALRRLGAKVVGVVLTESR